MVKNLRQAKQEHTKAVPPIGQWLSLAPTEEQLRNFEKALFRWCIENGWQQAAIRRTNVQAAKILPYLSELSPEWQAVDAKTFKKEANPQHKALCRVIDKYGKKAPAKELLDNEFKLWKEQKAKAEKQAGQSETFTWIPSEEGKDEQE